MPFNIPILLTWLRVALIPLVVGVFYLPSDWLTEYERGLAATIIRRVRLGCKVSREQTPH